MFARAGFCAAHRSTGSARRRVPDSWRGDAPGGALCRRVLERLFVLGQRLQGSGRAGSDAASGVQVGQALLVVGSKHRLMASNRSVEGAVAWQPVV